MAATIGRVCPEMELIDWCEVYILQRSISKNYANNLRCSAKQLTVFYGGYLPLKDLDAVSVNEWLAGLEAESPVKAVNKRRMIKSLWFAAYEAELVDPVRAIRRIKVPVRIPQAITIEQVQALLMQADKLTGCFKHRKITDVPRKLYWRSLVMAAWDTALRLGDLKKLQREWIAPDGTVGLVQSKTQRVHYVQFRPATMSMIDALTGGRTAGPIWGIMLNKKNFYVAARRLFAVAGVPGSIRWLRRASATYVEKSHPGTAWLHLGHASPGLDRTNYIDPTIARRPVSIAPEIPSLEAIGGAR